VQHHDFAQIRQRFVQRDALYELHSQARASPAAAEGSSETCLIRLDSEGVTWLMMEVRMASFAPRDRGHVHEGVVFLQIDMAVGLAEGRFGLEPLGVDEPSMTISASAGTSRSTVLAFHDVHGGADEPPATSSSSRDSAIFCVETKVMAGGAPNTTAAGIFCAALLVFQPVRVNPGRNSRDGFMPRRRRVFTWPR
jgi:hypothetical protein